MSRRLILSLAALASIGNAFGDIASGARAAVPRGEGDECHKNDQKNDHGEIGGVESINGWPRTPAP